MVNFLEVCSSGVLEEVSIFNRFPFFLGSKRIPDFFIEKIFFFYPHFWFWFLVFGFGFWFLVFDFGF